MNRELLERPFDKSLIRSRKGPFNHSFNYVEGAEYIRRLNEAFESNWSFEVLEHQVREAEVVVLGKIVADGVTKTSFGGSSITVSREGEVISIADDLKAAATDALKKAASLLGVGLHLYSSDRPTDAPGNGASKDNGNGVSKDKGNGRDNGNGRRRSTAGTSNGNRLTRAASGAWAGPSVCPPIRSESARRGSTASTLSTCPRPTPARSSPNSARGSPDLHHEPRNAGGRSPQRLRYSLGCSRPRCRRDRRWLRRGLQLLSVLRPLHRPMAT